MDDSNAKVKRMTYRFVSTQCQCSVSQCMFCLSASCKSGNNSAGLRNETLGSIMHWNCSCKKKKVKSSTNREFLSVVSLIATDISNSNFRTHSFMLPSQVFLLGWESTLLVLDKPLRHCHNIYLSHQRTRELTEQLQPCLHLKQGLPTSALKEGVKNSHHLISVAL